VTESEVCSPLPPGTVPSVLLHFSGSVSTHGGVVSCSSKETFCSDDEFDVVPGGSVGPPLLDPPEVPPDVPPLEENVEVGGERSESANEVCGLKSPLGGASNPNGMFGVSKSEVLTASKLERSCGGNVS